MAVFKQRKVGFKVANKLTPIEGRTSRVASLKELRAKQNKAYVSQVKSLSNNGRKAAVKTIVVDKAKEMFESLKQIEKPYFEELLNEIKLNSNMSIADISVRVARTLKLKNPSEYYSVGKVNDLYKAGVKRGVIKLS